jgi:DNA-binding transcriptional ArsR family regulator
MVEAPFAFDGLDRVFHEKARLGILTSLAGHPDGLGFTEVRQLTGLTDGNLSRHIQVLEEAGLVALTKRFDDYLDTLERVLRDAARATSGTRMRSTPREKPA